MSEKGSLKDAGSMALISEIICDKWYNAIFDIKQNFDYHMSSNLGDFYVYQ